MEPEPADSSPHGRIMRALARGARVQQESRALIATTRAIHTHLDATRAELRRAREAHVARAGVRNQTSR